jgi:hypothetical protein
MPLVSIHSMIPDAEDLLVLEPEELAGVPRLSGGGGSPKRKFRFI